MLVPNMQNRFYPPGSLPEGIHPRAESASGGRVLFSAGMTIAQAMGESLYRIRRKVEREFDPAAYQDSIVVLDIEHPVNPGKLERTTPEDLEKLASAMELRFAVLAERLPASCQIFAWVAGRAWQEDEAIDDHLEIASLIHLARLGAFRNTHGLAVRCYPAIAPTVPGWPRHEQAIAHAVRSTRAIALAAEHDDNRPRKVMAQLTHQAHTREGKIALPTANIHELIQSAAKAEADLCGLWSNPDELSPDDGATLVRELHALNAP